MFLHLFPFDKIPKDSTIIIYGAGNVGNEYLEQIEQTGWCNVESIVDKDYARYKWMSLSVREPEYLISGVTYDYVVIAIEAVLIADQIKANLHELGIPMQKIVNISERYLNINNQKNVIDYSDKPYIESSIRIAFRMVGSMGTYIIYLRLLEEIVKICPGCEIDLFCKSNMAKPFYTKQPNVREIKEFNQIKNESEQYDIILKVWHVIHLEKLFYQKVYKICPSLAKKLERLYNDFSNYYCNLSSEHCADNVFIKKAGFLGITRYTALSHGGIFDLSNKKVNIPVDKEFETLYKKLKLKKYITFNRGAAEIPGEMREQTKIWPKNYFEDFIAGFKRAFSDIEVIQVGSKNLEKVNGAGRYFLGEDIELVKYILKNSIFHLDCEGGLVHLATQLETKCIVLFGPTSAHYFGYEQNINIETDLCNDCRGIAADWAVNCYRKTDKQICMHSITPEMVLEKAMQVMSAQ